MGRPGLEVFHRRGKWEPSEWQGLVGGELVPPSGVELLLFGGFLVGTAIGLFGLLQGVAAFVLLLHPVQHESHQTHSKDEAHQASSNDT